MPINSSQCRLMPVPACHPPDMHAVVILSLAAAALAATAEDGQLLFVTFVHRHGDRSPVGTYPTDPHGNESIWNNGWGELTNAGKQRAYSLGKWLRGRYADFLPNIYNKNDYEVQSTDVSRTLMSGSLVLAGLYEPTGTDVWHSGINWQPIPVHTIPTALDNVLAGGKPCPKHTMLMVQLMLSREILSQISPIADTLSKIVTYAGYNSTNVIADFLTAALIYDSLNVQNQNGLQLPEWSKPYFPKPLEELSSLMLRLSTYNRPLQRLACGLLVQDIVQHLKSKAQGTLRKKIWQYSAHDVTIVGLRQCLGFKETDSPPYSSALILELRQKNGEYYVKLMYKALDTLRTLVVPGCTELCPLLKFEELTSPVIPEDWENECKI